MNLEAAKTKLKTLRARQRKLRKEIDILRNAIREAGEDPDAPEIDLVPRNKEMYRQWKTGKSFVQISKEFAVTPTTVGTMCKRIQKILEREIRRNDYDKYKDLRKYKRKGNKS